MMATNMDDHVARVGGFGPEEPALLEDYTPNMPVITFKNGMTMHVGDHTFEMIPHAWPHPVSGGDPYQGRGRCIHQRQYIPQSANLAS